MIGENVNHFLYNLYKLVNLTLVHFNMLKIMAFWEQIRDNIAKEINKIKNLFKDKIKILNKIIIQI